MIIHPIVAITPPMTADFVAILSSFSKSGPLLNRKENPKIMPAIGIAKRIALNRSRAGESNVKLNKDSILLRMTSPKTRLASTAKISKSRRNVNKRLFS